MKKLLLIIFIIQIMFGCVTKPTIISEANTIYNKKINKILIVVSLSTRKKGREENKEFYSECETILSEKYNEMNVENKVEILNNYKFDKLDIEKIINDYQPEVLLVIEQGETWGYKSGRIRNAVYIIKLIDIKTEGYIWQAEIELYGYKPNNYGTDFANQIFTCIMEQTDKDGLTIFQ